VDIWTQEIGRQVGSCQAINQTTAEVKKIALLLVAFLEIVFSVLQMTSM
jgi:hypothetical protein